MESSWQEMADRVRNWGRWGADDEIGTLNYVTPETTLAALALPRLGQSLSLSVRFEADGPQGASGFRRNPIHVMTVDGGDGNSAEHLSALGGSGAKQVAGVFGSGPMRFNDDLIVMPLQAATQWDALSHVYYEGLMYNGFPAAAVTSFGASRNSIDEVARRGLIVTRGLLLDVPRFRGLARLAPNTRIEPDELTAVCAAEGIAPRPGDVIVVRTGAWAGFLEHHDHERWIYESPGLAWECAEWLHDHQAAAVAADNVAVESVPSGVEGARSLLHMLALRDMGMPLGEIWDLEALGAACAVAGRYEFLLIAQPLRFAGAVGSPLNPIAIL